MCHVLIIEDEALIALSIEMTLERAGATSFDIVATEADAIEAARAQPPALIASDVKLLQGTGPRAVEVILRERGVLPVIFMTGTPDECVPCEPPAIILTKPVSDERLTATFRDLVGGLVD
jgi:CheY-like chemotaxis protein